MDEAENAAGDEVKIYASDPGHQLESPEPTRERRLAGVETRCREQIVQRPWAALAVASLAGGALGAVAGFYARKRR